MGTVFKARDTRLKRNVAIKILNRAKISDEQIQRFHREAKAAGGLSHDNLVTVYDFGLNDRSEPYLVMELVEGATISDCIKKYGRLSYESVIDIAVQIARGMAYAHENGVIHRDLKSSNIVLTSPLSGERNQVKIIDFGIARLLTDEAAGGKLTMTNAIVGSPAYLSPEQAQGGSGDEVSDIYSLGCILFEALTGELPFSGESFLEVMRQKTTSDPPHFSSVTDAEIPGGLKRIVYRCLKRKAEERYQSMQDLLVDLEMTEQLILDETLILPPEEAKARVEKARSEGRLGTIIAIGATLLVGVLGVATSLYFYLNRSEGSEYQAAESHKATLTEPFTDTKSFFEREVDRKELRKSPAGDGKLHVKGRGDIGDKDIIALKGEKVMHLDIQGRKVTDKAMPVIASFPVEVLELQQTDITGKSLSYLANSRTLKDLRFRCNQINDADLRSLKNVRLKNLRLTSCPDITNDGIKTIYEQWPNLEVLHIAGTSIDKEGFALLPKFKHLREIDVSFEHSGEDGLDSVTKMPALKSLYVARSVISKPMLEKFATMKNLAMVKFVTCRGLEQADYLYLKKKLPHCDVRVAYL